MTTEPAIQFKDEQHYVAIRTRVKMSDIPTILPPLIPEVFQWVEKNGLIQTGPCFFRYLSYDDDDQLLVDVGVPVQEAVAADGKIIAGSFPAANYVNVTYTGDYKDLHQVHMALESWMKENDIKEGMQEIDGKKYGARIEFYVTDPQEEPDPAKWRTDVSVLLVNK